MKISNEQIIESARRGRQKVESKMTISPCKRTSPSLWGGWVGAVAASLISFFAGYALHGGMPQPQPTENPVAQVVEVQHDTIMQVQTVRDTIYETRVVTKYEPMLAKAELRQHLRKKTTRRQSRKPAPCCATTFPTNYWQQGDNMK